MRRSRTTPSGESTNYLASVSDLMSGLIFIFIITVAVFALRLSRATETYTSAERTREEVLAEIKKTLEKEGLPVEIDLDHGVLSLTDRVVYFDRGQAVPAPDYVGNVGVIARVLSGVLCQYVSRAEVIEPGPEWQPPSYCGGGQGATPSPCKTKEGPKVETLLIEGHTDSVPIGPGFRYRDNVELSSARAAEILRMMQGCEPRLDGLQNGSGMRVLSVSGYGESRPVDQSDTTSVRNRRIDLRFLMELPREADDERQQPREPEPARETREGLGA